MNDPIDLHIFNADATALLHDIDNKRSEIADEVYELAKADLLNMLVSAKSPTNAPPRQCDGRWAVEVKCAIAREIRSGKDAPAAMKGALREFMSDLNRGGLGIRVTHPDDLETFYLFAKNHSNADPAPPEYLSQAKTWVKERLSLGQDAGVAVDAVLKRNHSQQRDAPYWITNPSDVAQLLTFAENSLANKVVHFESSNT